jgi:hypothetical protein
MSARKVAQSVHASLSDDLYFIRVGRFLKIGRTRNLKERLRILSCHAPTKPELVGSIPGAGATERVWHYAFRRARSHREWFRITGSLKQTVDAALRGENWLETAGPDWWRAEVTSFAVRDSECAQVRNPPGQSRSMRNG